MGSLESSASGSLSTLVKAKANASGYSQRHLHALIPQILKGCNRSSAQVRYFIAVPYSVHAACNTVRDLLFR